MKTGGLKYFNKNVLLVTWLLERLSDSFSFFLSYISTARGQPSQQQLQALLELLAHLDATKGERDRQYQKHPAVKKVRYLSGSN